MERRASASAEGDSSVNNELKRKRNEMESQWRKNS